MTENNKKMRILVIPSDLSGGGVGKFRSFDPHVYLQEHYKEEFDVDIMGMKDIDPNTASEFLKQYDLVVYHKEMDKQGTMINLCKFLGIPMICDIDDSPVLTPSHPLYISWKKQNWLGIMRNHLESANYVTCTTELFAKELKKYNKNVEVLPNAIDENEAQFSNNKKPSKRIRFGIVCGSTHMKDIELIQNLSTLPQPIKDKMQIVLCGADWRGQTTVYTPDGKSTVRPIRPEESIWCAYERYLTNNYKEVSDAHKDFLTKNMQGVDDPFEDEFYRRFCTRDIKHYGTHYENVDVLLAPIQDNVFNNCKSELKEIEAGFTHTALIASEVGPYTINLKPYMTKGNEIHEDGNALLVSLNKTHKFWKKYITYLVEHPEAITKLQDNLQSFVKENYTLEVVTAKRAELYKKVVAEHVTKLSTSQQ